METPPEKVRITPQLIEEWEYDAGVLLDANCGEEEIVRDLRERGCTPLLARQIVARARGPVRTQHRILGIYALLGGICLVLLGWWSLHNSVLSHYHKVDIGEMLVGSLSALIGAFKLLTGSAVDVETTIHGTADSDLDQGRY